MDADRRSRADPPSEVGCLLDEGALVGELLAPHAGTHAEMVVQSDRPKGALQARRPG